MNSFSQPIPKKHNIGLILLIVGAFIIGIWFWERTNVANAPAADSYLYDRLAVGMIEQKWSYFFNESLIVPPLYPAFLAIVYLCAGKSNLIAASVANIALFALVVGLVGWVGMRQFSVAAGYLAGVLVAVNPDLLFWGPFVLSEMLFIFFLVLLAIALNVYSVKWEIHWLLFAGILAGLAALTRGAFQIYIVPILLWIIFVTPGSIVSRFLRSVFFCLVMLAMVIPYSYWISVNRNEVVVVVNYGLSLLAHGNRPEYYSTLMEYLFGSNLSWLNLNVPNLPNDQILQVVWDFISSSPLDWMHLYLIKLYYHLQFFNMKDINSIRIAVWSTGYWLVVWPLVAAFIIKTHSPLRNIYLWIISANLFLHPLLNIERYHRFRIPVEPLFALLASGGVSLLIPYYSHYIPPTFRRIQNRFQKVKLSL